MPISRDVPGALHGSRLLEQPRLADEVARWRAFLAQEAPVLLEIGFDHGFRLADTSARHPGWLVAGLEVRRHRVDQARERAEAHGRDNVLVWRMDARTVLAGATPPGSLRIVEVLFPDPWWNPRHRTKRLLVESGFLDDVVRALEPGGVLHIATDVPRYADHIRDLLAQRTDLTDDPGAAQERPAIEATSRREWRCAQDGLPIHRFWLRTSTASEG